MSTSPTSTTPTGASTAALAIVLIDARQGVLGTMAFLRWVRGEISEGNVGQSLSSDGLRQGFDGLAREYLWGCE